MSRIDRQCQKFSHAHTKALLVLMNILLLPRFCHCRCWCVSCIVQSEPVWKQLPAKLEASGAPPDSDGGSGEW